MDHPPSIACGDSSHRRGGADRHRSPAVRTDGNTACATFTIDAEPPFRLDLTVWALRRRAINRTDRWDGSEYSRAICVGEAPIRLAVRQVEFGKTPRLLVRAAGSGDDAHIRKAARATLERMLGLRLDLAGFYATAAANPPLDELAQRFRGMRPPRFPSMFEALVNGVACQQISLQAGLTVLNRLVAAYGKQAHGSAPEDRAFPTPDVIAAADPDALMAIGLSRAKSVAIKGIAMSATLGDLNYDALAELDDVTALAKLDKLRGVGRWTAEYALLRGCGRLNIFPGDDVGARNNLQRWLGRRSPLDYESTRTVLRRWQPYAGLVYLHLLLRHLEDEGALRAAIA